MLKPSQPAGPAKMAVGELIMALSRPELRVLLYSIGVRRLPGSVPAGAHPGAKAFAPGRARADALGWGASDRRGHIRVCVFRRNGVGGASAVGWRVSHALVGLFAVAAVLTFTGSATAAITRGETPAHQAITAGQKLPEATTEAQAVINQAALAPRVKKAIKAGEAKALFESTKDPDIIFDLVRFDSKVTSVNSGEHTNHAKPPKPKKGVTGPAETSKGSAPEPISDRLVAPLDVRAPKPVAHTAGCWGSWAADTYYLWFGSEVIAWDFARENGWCGGWNGYAWVITWLGGPTFAEWQWKPVFCAAPLSTNYTWDGSTSWVHMADWQADGVVYPWGCLLYWNLKAVVRIAGNGYWDTYDDYGF